MGRAAAAGISPPLATSFCRVASRARLCSYYSSIELEAEEEEVAGAELFGCVRDGEARETASFINTKQKPLAHWRCARFGWVGSVRLGPGGWCLVRASLAFWQA